MKSCDSVTKPEMGERLKGKGLNSVEKSPTAPSRNIVPGARTQHHTILAHFQGRLCLAVWTRFTEADPEACSNGLSAVRKISLAVFASRGIKKFKWRRADPGPEINFTSNESMF
jgi:hypothetical protein